MKNIFKTLTYLAFFTGLSLAGCVEQEFDAPPGLPLPEGESVTIQDLIDAYNQQGAFKIDSTLYLFATVTADEGTGNFYKQLVVQDAKAGITFRMRESATNVRIGDSIKLVLDGLIVSNYMGVMQIDSIEPAYDIIVLANGKNITPEVVTLAELKDGKYTNKVIQLNDVQFLATDTLKTYANGYNLETENRTLTDCAGNSALVRTSGYANFANDSVAKGKGSIIVIGSQYKTDIQLYIRDYREINMTDVRCGGTANGGGTFNDPYNVGAAISGQGTNDVWVKGYLVGVYETIDANGNTLAEFAPSFTAPFYTNSNAIIADNPNETSIGNCIVVQLTAGEIRTVTNLVDNADKLGKEIMYKGNLAAYFGKAGLKETNGYWYNGNGINPDVNSSALFNEDFKTNLGQFNGISVSGDQVWKWASWGSGCAAMTGHVTENNVGVNYANEDWLISPQIDLSGKSNTILKLSTAIKYNTGFDNTKVLISTDYSGNVQTATWTEITDYTKPASDFVFVDSGDIDLSTYDGQKIHIAFKYVSTTSASATWEIGSVTVQAE